MKVDNKYVAGVASSTSCRSLILGGKLGNNHVFIYQVERTVATLLTDWRECSQLSLSAC